MSPRRLVSDLFWRLVFAVKRRAGWLVLAPAVTVVGRVIRVDPPGSDGDGNFDVLLDPGQDHVITSVGGRLTCCPPVVTPSIHCEVTTWGSPDDALEAFADLRPGQRVRVVGQHGFDGVHTGRSMPVEIVLALLGHQPNVADGWCEIHPVRSIVRLSGPS